MKLPAFYLLDAISKNVYDPYARRFGAIVVRLFIDTYEQVDPNTRSKMIEMLTTWRNGAPSGKELFGVVNQLAIERHIWPDDASRTVAVSSSTAGRRCVNRRPWHRQSSSRGNPSAISTQQVLSELEYVLSQKERAAQANPYDKQAQNHVAVLHQVSFLCPSLSRNAYVCFVSFASLFKQACPNKNSAKSSPSYAPFRSHHPRPLQLLSRRLP